MNRTRAQRRLRRLHYTYESTYLKEPFDREGFSPKLILISRGRSSSWREYRPYLLPGEVIRPVGHSYLHNGKKPR